MHIASALGEFAGHPSASAAVQCLLGLLRDEDPMVRGRAVGSLNGLGEPAREALPVLKDLAQDDRFYHDLVNPRFLVEYVLERLQTRSAAP
jgi:hypothetical protein